MKPCWWHGVAYWAVVAGGLVSTPAFSSAQQLVTAERGVERADSALLARPVSVQLERMSLRTAVIAVANAARVQLLYQKEVLDAVATPVTIRATNMPLGRVFALILEGTHLTAQPVRSDLISIEPIAGSGVRAPGDIDGRVLDKTAKRPLHGVSVMLDDSSHVTRTDDAGRFHFTSVPPGNHRLFVRMIGFAQQSRVVTVGEGQSLTVDFTLSASVNTLDQVVVTATGEQRYRELGHVVSTINADSVVREAPITSVSELLQARIPGLQVITTNGGVAGAPVALRLRGQTSLSLNSEPVLIIDGVRYRSNSMIQVNGLAQQDNQGGGPPPSPLNDLNVNDIESVEVVKGPSASTLYGPEASNGVIVITTKRARSSQTRWSWYVHPLINTIPTQQRLARTGYHVWGHDPGGQPVSYCSLVYQYDYHLCTIDSITTQTTFIDQDQYAVLGKNRPGWQYGLNVSGGSGSTHYYLSGGYDRQDGVIQVPLAIQRVVAQQLGAGQLSGDIRNPNSMAKTSAHSNVTMQPWSWLDLNATADYNQSVQHRVTPNSVFAPSTSTVFVPPATDSASILSYLSGTLYSTTLALTSDLSNMSVFTGTIQPTARPTSWLTVSGVIGTTKSGTDNYLLRRTLVPSAREDTRASNGRTLTLNTSAAARSGLFSFRTALGVQYLYQKDNGLSTTGNNMARGSSNIATASSISLVQSWNETVTLGTYGQEIVGLADQLFFDAGLRVDGSTRFGEDYHPSPLPKAELSWIVSEQPAFRQYVPWATELRLRTAYGQATRYPTTGMKLGSLSVGSVQVGSQSLPAYFVGNLANPTLRPERSRETEYGLDATLFHRVQLGVTWWQRRTNDELKYLSNPSGSYPAWANVASVSQHGREMTLSLPIVEGQAFQASLQAAYAFNTSKILNLGDNIPLGAYTTFRPGYPIDAIFGSRTIGVADTVGGAADGIVFPEEIITDSIARFLGVINPPRTFTLTPTATMLGGRLRMSAMFDRETGFVLHDDIGMYCRSNFTCLAPFDKNASLMAQARTFTNYYDFVVPGDFTRWREVNLTVDLPLREWLGLSAVHLDAFSHASVSLQGRNLALWTKYKGSDPESHSDFANPFSANASGIPQARSWAVRFDLTP